LCKRKIKLKPKISLFALSIKKPRKSEAPRAEIHLPVLSSFKAATMEKSSLVLIGPNIFQIRLQ
jgi:hypothetical protein